MKKYVLRSDRSVTVLDPDGMDCVLAVGDAGDLPGIRAWLYRLPRQAYGHVFIEVFSDIQIEPLPLPPYVGVTWICRERAGSGAGRRDWLTQPRGDALARAVDSWLDEWIWVEGTPARELHVWAGARSSSVMRSYWCRFERKQAEWGRDSSEVAEGVHEEARDRG